MSNTNEPMAYMTRDEEGSPEMLFFDPEAAARYCLVGEEPEALHPASLVEQQRRRIAELEAKAARYDWLQERLLGADWEWGDPATSVWVFETDAPLSADLDASIDAARSELRAVKGGAE